MASDVFDSVNAFERTVKGAGMRQYCVKVRVRARRERSNIFFGSVGLCRLLPFAFSSKQSLRALSLTISGHASFYTCELKFQGDLRQVASTASAVDSNLFGRGNSQVGIRLQTFTVNAFRLFGHVYDPAFGTYECLLVWGYFGTKDRISGV